MLLTIFYRIPLFIFLWALSASVFGINNLIMAFHLRIISVGQFGYVPFENEYNKFSFGVVFHLFLVLLPLIFLIFYNFHRN